MAWYEKKIEKFSPVISTRVRFARNLEGYPFPHRLNGEGRKGLWDQVKNALIGEGFSALYFPDLSSAEKHALLEKRLVSAALLKRGEGAGVFLSSDEEISLMVGEEDHIRLQVLSVGKEIDKTLEKALAIEEKLSEKLSFAYREGLGYLTSCPTNLGAGVRISVMIHLPALTALSAVGELGKSLGACGFTLRGAFGEGSRGTCGIYQISNQLSREKTPFQIGEGLSQVLLQVEEAEQKAAAKLFSENKTEILDRIGRAIGLVSFAEKMSYSEFAEHFSHIRFGKALGLEKARAVPVGDELLFSLSPFHLVQENPSLKEEEKRDMERCRKLKEKICKK